MEENTSRLANEIIDFFIGDLRRGDLLFFAGDLRRGDLVDAIIYLYIII